MGVEAVKIKRAKYIEAGEKVCVHALTYGKFLSELHNHLQSMLSDISGNVSGIIEGKSALVAEVWKILDSKFSMTIIYNYI